MLAQTKLHITAQLAHQASVISLCNRLTGVENKIQETFGSVRRRIFGHLTSSQRIKIYDELKLLKAVTTTANIQQDILQTTLDELKGSQEWLTENEDVKEAIMTGFDCLKNMLVEGGDRLSMCWRWWMEEAVKEARLVGCIGGIMEVSN
jgi:hypothetical protein